MQMEHFLMTKASVLITHTIPLLACSIILIHYLALNKERRSAESTNEDVLSRSELEYSRFTDLAQKQNLKNDSIQRRRYRHASRVVKEEEEDNGKLKDYLSVSKQQVPVSMFDYLIEYEMTKEKMQKIN
ncbi:hypothetical protein T11_14956 [Trichinella zimbabwensis]|uniref:Uncharacterized protein n=1 Tax=Trichinella zimbabwensis TaxID=268475 RepID=A0A0V1I668_9BILA|nr:hypothetical protein T11_14956 [Trichinella zimbabwensis]